MKATKKPQIMALLEKGEKIESISTKTGASLVYIRKLEKKMVIKAKPIATITKPKAKSKQVDNNSLSPAERTYWCRNSIN